MNSFLLRWILSALLLALALPFLPAQAASRHHVLMLHSYHQGMDWTDGEAAGVRDSVAKSGLAVDVHVEYMDAKRLVDKTHFENLRRLFQHKYKAAQINAIVVTDNDAYDFMRRYRDELFPGVPVVFCGVNQFSSEQLKGLSGFTGVVEKADITATLDLMLRLHPTTRRIVIVADNTTTGKALRSELIPVTESFRNQVDFDWWDSFTPQELAAKFSALPSDHLVLLMPYASDRNGNFISHKEVARLLTKNSVVPVYTNWDLYLGHGIVGGSLTTAKDQGGAAGEMLVKILQGEKADNIPVRRQVPGAFMFDHRQLTRFNIPKSQLPEYSTIIFQPWHDTNLLLIWGGTIVALTLAVMFWVLLVNISRKRQADAALRVNIAILQSHDSALEEISQGVLISGTDRRLTYVNRAVEGISGYSRKELLGVTCDLLQGPETDQETRQQIRLALEKARPFHGEILNYRKDGSSFWNELSISPVFDADGKLSQFVGIQSDITARKQAEVDLRIAAKAFESQVAMLVADAEGIILRVNQAFTDATGYSAEEAIGRKTSLLKSGRHDQPFYEALWSTLLKTHYWQGVIWNRRKDGSIYAEWLTINAVLAADGEITHYVSAFSNITQNKAAEAEVHRLAYYDHLTQLPNRRLLHDRLEQALALAARTGRYGAVLFLDLDNFNTLNDTRGHNTGDLLLIQTAERLRQTLGAADTVARLGGDEFVILLEELSDEAESAAAIAQHTTVAVGEAIAQTYNLNGFECISTVSIGICLFKGEESVELLLKNAEIAMYEAKAGGRKGWCFFDPAMQAVLDKRSTLENHLRQAIKRDELQLYYQPQVELSGRVVGAEALLRWKHTKLGFISPGEFIPLAEESGLILPIGQWVLESACQQIKAWSRDAVARTLRVSVNISPLQFRRDDFVENLRTLLTNAAIDASRLRLELTENLILDDVEKTIAKMYVVKAMGISFSIDDFGTGYSSLAYLTNLPIDELKIDKSFVANVPGNRNDEIIVQSIITLGSSLNLSVIAEGVETEAQRDFLAQQGCHALQGYLYSRPLPPDEFVAKVL